MSLGHQVLATLAVATLSFATGWGAHVVKAERDQLQAENDAQRGARTLEAQARRQQAAASDTYQAQLAQIRAQLAAHDKEADDALQQLIPCAPGASMALADLPVPAASVDRLRRAAAGVP